MLSSQWNTWFSFNNSLSGAVWCDKCGMYGFMKLSTPRNDYSCCISMTGYSVTSCILSWLGFMSSFLNKLPQNVILGYFTWHFMLLDTRSLLLAIYIKWSRLVLCSSTDWLYKHKSLWIHHGISPIIQMAAVAVYIWIAWISDQLQNSFPSGLAVRALAQNVRGIGFNSHPGS